MKEKKNILVFSYSDMRLGGIQKILYGYIQSFQDRGDRVIWVAPEKPEIDQGFRGRVNRERMMICGLAQAQAYLTDFCGKQDATVVILSFRPSDYLKMVRLELSLAAYDVRNYLAVAHYKGGHLFLEENYRGNQRERAFGEAKAFYACLLKNGSLMFCSPKQAEVFEEHYRLVPEDRDAVVLPVPVIRDRPEDADIQNRVGKDHIISVCRFSFPHKGYVLGLIRAYGVLKERYPRLRLTLVGFGDGTEQVHREIRELKERARQDVRVIPGVPLDQLPAYFAEASVAVGLAGAASASASDSLVTLVARHYCEDCETYGSYADCWEKVLSEEPGRAIIPELERVLNLDEEEYLEESRRTRDAYERKVLPRQRDICADCSVEKACPLTAEQIAALKAMTARAEGRLRRKRWGHWLTHPGYVLKKLKGKITG